MWVIVLAIVSVLGPILFEMRVGISPCVYSPEIGVSPECLHEG